MKAFVALALMLYLLYQSFDFGLRWNAVAHPTPGVTVTWLDGSVPMEHGTLQRDWHGAETLVTEDGRHIRLSDKYAYELAFQPRRAEGGHIDVSSEGILSSSWRAALPPSLALLGVWMTAAVVSLRQRLATASPRKA